MRSMILEYSDHGLEHYLSTLECPGHTNHGPTGQAVLDGLVNHRWHDRQILPLDSWQKGFIEANGRSDFLEILGNPLEENRHTLSSKVSGLKPTQ